MADVKITALPAATSVVPGTDVLPLVTGGGATTSKATPNQVVNAVLSASPTITSPTLVTPLLGTPVSGNFSSGTFTWPTFNQSTSGNAATATTAVNLSGTQTANYFYAAPNGSSGAGSWRAIVAADIPTLNQNTTGTAAGLSATLAVASGGTGVTASSGASSVVLRDANANVSANNFFPGFTKTTNPVATIVLTAASSYFQKLSGTSNGTYKLPDATTLPAGATFIFDNDSTGTVTIIDTTTPTPNIVDILPAGGIDFIYLEDNTTSAGSWSRYAFVPASYNFSGTIADFGTAAIQNTPSITIAPVAFNALPTPAAGMRAFVNNSSANTFGATADGAGANTVPVWYNGSNWLVG